MDIATNIKKYFQQYNVKIYSEENFFGNQEENIMVYDVNKGEVESSEIYCQNHIEMLIIIMIIKNLFQ